MAPDQDAHPDAAGPRLHALPIADLVTLLRHAGSQHVSAEAIRADLAAGAPSNRDGTINLAVYLAWLVRELARREKTHG